jgi:tRNA (guanine26-N2/guanine27-N2)-dimethyltransferase
LTELISEGRARIAVDGVFYNPRMRLCRDIDMIVFSELRKSGVNRHSYLDALAATGIRGIRACLEAEFTPFFNDVDRKAVEMIKQNLQLNGIEAEVFNRDAVSLMRDRSFFHIDIDPFGSPAQFVDAACYSARRFLSVTATDIAALCGSATVSGLRKYSAYAIKTPFMHEVGIRMLLGKVAREATKYDKAVQPVVSWAKEHYYRIHLRVIFSSKEAGKVYGKIGYIMQCGCGRIWWNSMYETPETLCSCGEKAVMLGPLWLGELERKDFVEKLVERSEGKLKDIFSRIYEELNIPFHYDLHNICRRLRAAPPPIEKVIRELRELGYAASRTRFSGTSFKTDAILEDIEKIIIG